jgi:hypothetical protein
MRKKSLFLVACLLSQQTLADVRSPQEELALQNVMTNMEEAKVAAENLTTNIAVNCPEVTPQLVPVAHCPWMLTQQIQKDREDGIINDSVHSKCGDRYKENIEKIVDPVTGKKNLQSIEPERMEAFYQSSKSTAAGAPSGSLTQLCLGPKSGLQNDNDRIAVLSEYTLLRSRIAIGAEALVQEIYDIESNIPFNYKNGISDASWDKFAVGDEANTLKRLKSGYSAIPGMTDLMKQRDNCNTSMDLAQNRYNLKELRFKQSKVTLAQISGINKELQKIKATTYSAPVQAATMGGYIPPVLIPLSKEQQEKVNQLNAIKETLLDSIPWLKSDEFKPFIHRSNLHRVDSEGKPARDEAGELAWHFKGNEEKEIELAFHKQAQNRRKIVLEELKKIEEAAGCINGSSTSCNYNTVMENLANTPELAEGSNILRMDVLDKSEGAYRPDDITQAAIIGMDSAASCRQAYRGIHRENNKLTIQIGVDVAITAATAGVTGAVAATVRAGAAATAAAAATTVALRTAAATGRLAQLVNRTKKVGLAMRAMAASSKAQNLVKIATKAKDANGLIQAINECDSKIVPKIESDLGSLSCKEFSEQNLEAEHTGCLASVALSLGGHLPNVINPAIRKVATLTPGGEKIFQALDNLEEAAKVDNNAFSKLKLIEGADKLVENTVKPKGKLKDTLVTPLKDDEAAPVTHASIRNKKIFLTIVNSNNEKNNTENARLLLSTDPTLEGLTDNEKLMVKELAASYK